MSSEERESRGAELSFLPEEVRRADLSGVAECMLNKLLKNRLFSVRRKNARLKIKIMAERKINL